MNHKIYVSLLLLVSSIVLIVDTQISLVVFKTTQQILFMLAKIVTWIQNLSTIVAIVIFVVAVVLTCLTIRQTSRNTKSTLFMEMVKEESRLQSDIRHAEQRDRQKFIEPYLNFFDCLAILWKREIPEDYAKRYFGDMIIRLFDKKYILKHIIDSRRESINAYTEIEKLYKKLGGKICLN